MLLFWSVCVGFGFCQLLQANSGFPGVQTSLKALRQEPGQPAPACLISAFVGAVFPWQSWNAANNWRRKKPFQDYTPSKIYFTWPRLPIWENRESQMCRKLESMLKIWRSNAKPEINHCSTCKMDWESSSAEMVHHEEMLGTERTLNFCSHKYCSSLQSNPTQGASEPQAGPVIVNKGGSDAPIQPQEIMPANPPYTISTEQTSPKLSLWVLMWKETQSFTPWASWVSTV